MAAPGKQNSRALARWQLATGGLVAAAVVVMLPLAVAWACVPGAAIGFDRAVYEYRAGETVTVLGRAFAPSTQVTLTLQPPQGPSTTVGNGVLTDSAGFFRDSFAVAASAAPGAYVVVASVNTTDVDGHGRTYEAREAFTLTPPPAPPTPPSPITPPTPALKVAPAVGLVFAGTAGDDTILGTPFADVITCGRGDDRVRSAGGNDSINCGPGNDRIDSGSGNDRVSGGPGRDHLLGGAGKDRLAGESGNDKLSGGPGNDALRGNAGTDKLYGGSGRDTLFRDRRDKLYGGAGKDRIIR